MSLQDNCPNCFSPMGGAAVCPHCGYDPSKEKKYTGTLPAFTILHERYLLGRVLGKGGFGITYLAKNFVSDRVCAVKEYMPSEYSSRSSGSMTITPFNDDKSRAVFNHGREKFVEEARVLSKLRDNPIVVDILDFFEENNTAYIVMEYLDGSDLKNQARANGGKLDPEYAKRIFVTVASSLMAIHNKGILHRDLSPDNIIVTKDERIKLIDFGAARSYISGQNKGMSILLKVGYAPPEQYDKKGDHGPWSDVYALCATFYKLVSGHPLVDALFRYRGEPQPTLAELKIPVSKKTSDVIAKGMELDIKKRYQNFKQLLDDLDFAGGSKPSRDKEREAQAERERAVREQAEREKRKREQEANKQQEQRSGRDNSQQAAQSEDHGDHRIETSKQQGKRSFFSSWFGGKKENAVSVSPIPEKKTDPGIPVKKGTPVNSVSGHSFQPNKIPGPPKPMGGERVKVPVGGPPSMYRQEISSTSQNSGQVQAVRNAPVTPQRPPEPKPYVAAVIGNELRNRMPIGVNQKFSIGRSEQSSEYVISGDQNISREHCRVRFDGKTIYLTDLSANGTFLDNGLRLKKGEETPVSPGTYFYLATPNHMLIISI